MWERSYNLDHFNYARSIHQLANGNLLLVLGISNGVTIWSRSAAILLDSSGNTLWELVFDNTSLSDAVEVDGEIVLVGSSGRDFLLAGVDSVGSLLWREQFGSEHAERPAKVLPVSSSDFIVVGERYYFDSVAQAFFGSDAYFVKFSNAKISTSAGEVYSIVSSDLHQNFPNPFASSTTISVTMGDTGHARLELFAISGKRVAVLCDRILPTGKHSFEVRASDLVPGVYFYRLSTGSEVHVRSLTVSG